MNDISIKSKLNKLVEGTLKSEKTKNPNWFKGFQVIVKNGIVRIEKNNVISTHAFIYEDNAKDYNGYDWNLGALGNLVISWERENIK